MRLILSAVAAAILSGCALASVRGVVQEYDTERTLNEHGPRVASYLQEHPETRQLVRELLWQRRICLGMTREQVWAAWGRPCFADELTWRYQWITVHFERGLVSRWD